MTGENENGLSFGATIDLEDAAESSANVDLTDGADADYTVFVSGAFGTLTYGDTDGAMDWALTEGGNVGNPGSISDAETGHAGYAGSYLDGGANVARYNNSFGDYAVAVSVSQDANDDEAGYAIGLKGSVAGASFGIALQEAADDASLAGVSLGYSFGAMQAGVMIASGEDTNGADDELMQLGLGYSAGALSLHANYGTRDNAAGDVDGFGIAAAYDLGGGASVHFGYGDGEEVSAWSFGLAMSF